MIFKTIMCTWNSNGLSYKAPIVSNFLKRHKIDILLINETKLKVTQKFSVKGYKVLRKDRLAVNKGGIMILIRHDIPFKEVIINNLSFEYIALKLLDNTHVISVYNCPRNLFSIAELNALTNTGRKVIIAGDFNAHHKLWNCHINDKNGFTLLHFLNSNHNTDLHVTDDHTHFPFNDTTATTIDLFITKNIQHVSKPVSLPELDSDHNPILVTINGTFTEPFTKHVYSYKNTDWNEFRKTLDKTIAINKNISSVFELDKAVSNFTQSLVTAKNKHSCKIKINPNKDNLPDDILDLISKKNAIRKRWQSTGDHNLKFQMTKLISLVRQKVREHRNSTWRQKLQNLDTTDNSLWKFTKNLKKPFKSIPCLNIDNKQMFTDKEKCEALASSFEKVHDTVTTPADLDSDVIKTVEQFRNSDNFLKTNDFHKFCITVFHLKSLIAKLPNNKAPGMDGLENKILKNLSHKALVQLMYIINSVLKLNHFPKQWKLAIIVPLHKNNKDPSLVTSYRPISLLNSLAKITEKVILELIHKHEGKNRTIINEQFGFRRGHNTTLQVARIVNDIIINFNKSKITSMVLLDIEKAFDKVWIDGLIYKLIKSSLPKCTVALIDNYLSGRTFKVKVNNYTSNLKVIKSGVPQGSLLGPAIFNYYINDICKFEKTQMAIYADDTAVFSSSFHNEVAAKQIQLHLNLLEKYFQTWKITVNSEKTELISFSRRYTGNKIFSKPKLYNNVIKQVNSVKYLGVHLDSRLNFKIHLLETLKKAFRAKGQLHCLLSSRDLSTDNKRIIYKSLIRPIITYACPVWNSVSSSALSPLQIFQNKCLRQMTFRDKYTRIDHLHDITGIEFLRTHINRIANTFYKHHIHKSPLTRNLMNHKVKGRLKHKVPYHQLPIYQELVLSHSR